VSGESRKKEGGDKKGSEAEFECGGRERKETGGGGCKEGDHLYSCRSESLKPPLSGEPQCKETENSTSKSAEKVQKAMNGKKHKILLGD